MSERGNLPMGGGPYPVGQCTIQRRIKTIVLDMWICDWLVWIMTTLQTLSKIIGDST